MSKGVKTRSKMFLRAMNDDVHVAIERISINSGLPKWLVVEHLLEKALRIKSDAKVDFKNWKKLR